MKNKYKPGSETGSKSTGSNKQSGNGSLLHQISLPDDDMMESNGFKLIGSRSDSNKDITTASIGQTTADKRKGGNASNLDTSTGSIKVDTNDVKALNANQSTQPSITNVQKGNACDF